jgi:signal transduction histidine kinase
VSLENTERRIPPAPAAGLRGDQTAAWTWGLGAASLAAIVAAGYAAATDAGGSGVAFAAIAIAFAALAVGIRLRDRSTRTSLSDRAEIALLDSLLAAAPDAYLLWRDGDERRSPRFEALLGVDGDRPGPDPVLARLDGRDGARIALMITALRDTGTPFATTARALDGARRFRVEGGDLSAGGQIVWFRDITEIAADADAAREETRRLRATLDALSVPLWRRGADLSLEYCNRAYAEAVEADADDVASGNLGELVADAGRADAHDLAREAVSAGAPRQASHHAVVGGARRLLRLTEAPLEDGGGTVGIAWDVTDLEEAKRDLARHIGAHAEVLEKLATSIAIYGPDKLLKFFNGAFASLLKLDEDWLQTEPPFGEVLEALRARRRLPEVPDFPAFKKRAEAQFTGLIAPTEEVLHLSDGTVLHMVVTPHPFGGLLFTYEDVTDALTLERSHNTLIAVQRATLDNLFEGVAVFGSDGRLKLSNSGYASLWRIPAEELEGEPHISDVLERARELYDYGDDWDAYKAQLIGLASERTSRVERLERNDDKVFEWASVPLPDGATLMTYLDVTDSTKVERALRERAEALEEADHLKSEFIANVSYELRTPLNTIIGFSELLDAKYFGDVNERQAEYLKGILSSSNHLLQLINDILDLASIEAGYMEINPSRFDLDALIANMMSLTHERSRAGNVTLDVDVDGRIGEIVADERRIKQMLFHLVTNAIKFTPSGGTVSLVTRREGGGVSFNVSDTGPGIEPGDRERVFDKFWRGKPAQGKERGTGLGLSLVKSFVELHGGHVRLESRPDAGTSITCWIPAEVEIDRE